MFKTNGQNLVIKFYFDRFRLEGYKMGYRQQVCAEEFPVWPIPSGF